MPFVVLFCFSLINMKSFVAGHFTHWAPGVGRGVTASPRKSSENQPAGIITVTACPPPFHPHFNYILNNFIKVVRIEKVVLTHRRINRLHSFYLIYNCLYCSYSFSYFYFINISSVGYSCHHCQQLRGTFKKFPTFCFLTLIYLKNK